MHYTATAHATPNQLFWRLSGCLSIQLKHPHQLQLQCCRKEKERMCHLIIRTLCQICHTQIGNIEIKPLASCLPATLNMKPAWGSAAATLEQHRGKRVKRTTGLCEACRANMNLQSPGKSDSGSGSGSGESAQGTPEKGKQEVEDEF